MHIRGTSNHSNKDDESLQQKGATSRLARNDVTDEPNASRGSKASTSDYINSFSAAEDAISNEHKHTSPASVEEKSVVVPSRECNGHFGLTTIGDSTAGLACQVNENELELEFPNMVLQRWKMNYRSTQMVKISQV